MRRTKIVCTIGPATESEELLHQMIARGMDVARLNMSHGTHEWHEKRIHLIRRLAQEDHRAVAIIMDLQGPKIRTTSVRGGSVVLRTGQNLIIHQEEIAGDEHRIGVNHSEFAEEVSPGQMILIDDGMIRLNVLRTDEEYVETEVIVGGVLRDRRGVSVPDADFSIPSVTEKDETDLSFGMEHGVDYIAISFVRQASDISDVRRRIREHGADIPIIAKIETKKGLENFSEILKVSDGIMVARGDLGVEIPIEEVPIAQKMIIRESNTSDKPVITATQMLESMIYNATPTRAEVTDVANAILDGTDAIMLSGETTIGKYPIESLVMMDRVARRTESAGYPAHVDDIPALSIERGIGHAVCQLAHDLGAAAIITTTYSGSTARIVSMYRPRNPIIAVTPDETTFRRLALIWGVDPHRIPVTENTDEMVEASIRCAMDAGFVNIGDRVVLTAGVPMFAPGTTNLIRVHVV